MDSDNLTYLVFFGSLGIAIVLGLALPGLLHVTQEAAEEGLLLGLFPVMVWVAWRLRGEPPTPAPAEAPAASAPSARKS